MLLSVCYWIKALLHVLRFGIRRSIDTLNAMSCNSNCSNLNKRYSGCFKYPTVIQFRLLNHRQSLLNCVIFMYTLALVTLLKKYCFNDSEENWTFKPSGLNILTLVVLNIVSSFRWRCCISVHHILVHKRPSSEQTEASRAT